MTASSNPDPADKRNDSPVHFEFTEPAAIEQESMRRISLGLQERGIEIEEALLPVVRRVIHTTADFEYAETLFFTEDVITYAHHAIRGGKTIITDTNMALAGISKPACQKWNCQPVCYMADPEIAAKAKEDGTTRAYAAMVRAAGEYPDGIYVIGNAPTALLCLDRLIREGSCRPSLVIGVPVGFVNVVESKELLRAACLRCHIPAIFNMGQKGGSGVAAAVMNALLYTAGAD